MASSTSSSSELPVPGKPLGHDPLVETNTKSEPVQAFSFTPTTIPCNMNCSPHCGQQLEEHIAYNKQLVELFARVERRADELGQDMPQEFRNL
ncbi:hypothetical protein BASA81_004846 [Batrachochytrium salamandrivorans]|nr:hypothetical protein BASA81_004846 [Batrachochytrium salamandrivorans]